MYILFVTIQSVRPVVFHVYVIQDFVEKGLSRRMGDRSEIRLRGNSLLLKATQMASRSL